MVLYGMVLGSAAALGAIFYLGQVFDTGTLGPAPFVYSALIVGAVALTASFVPAWRATRVSPLVAIRNRG